MAVAPDAAVHAQDVQNVRTKLSLRNRRRNMIKMVVKVDGMMCSMCETRINEILYRYFEIKKASADRKKNCVVILSEIMPEPDKIREVIEEAGYTVGEITSEPYQKRSLFHL